MESKKYNLLALVLVLFSGSTQVALADSGRIREKQTLDSSSDEHRESVDEVKPNPGDRIAADPEARGSLSDRSINAIDRGTATSDAINGLKIRQQSQTQESQASRPSRLRRNSPGNLTEPKLILPRPEARRAETYQKHTKSLEQKSSREEGLNDTD